MTYDYTAILPVIEKGIDVARRNRKPGEPVPSDDFTAWCIVQELRRAGWRIVRASD
jgi:hypothetical protein